MTLPGTGQPYQYDSPITGYNKPLFDYSRIDAALNNPAFQQGQNLLKPDYTNSPETKMLLDNLDKMGAVNRDRSVSNSIALAGRRGLAGSSIEQFGAAQAGNEADNGLLQAKNQILLQATQRQQAARDLAAQALFGQAGAGIAGEYGLSQTGAQLNSDEITSLRNMMLGNQGIKLGYENIDQADKANQRANNPINFLLQGVGTGVGAAPF